MPGKILVISGRVGTGKSTLAGLLKTRYGFEVVSTRDVLGRLRPRTRGRAAYQRIGDELDQQTDGAWVANALRHVSEETSVVVDAVRIKPQIDELRRAFGYRVVHVHLRAPDSVLATRYRGRSGRAGEFRSYDAVQRNRTERAVDELGPEADVLIETSHSSAEDVVVRVASRLGLYGRGVERLVDVLVGGQFGSEGKGHVASFLAPEYDYLVRVGGPNAGHKVYAGKPRTFHHLPSGTERAPRAQVVIGPGAVVEPDALIDEIARAQLRFDRLAIDPQAMTIAMEDRAFESRTLTRSIGSTGQGVGAATARKVLRTAARPLPCLAKDVEALRPYIRPTAEILERAFARGERVFLEGTQGTALSLHHGEYPYVTSRETTVSGCLADAGIAPSRVRKILMVCRTYPIRVENPKGGSSGGMIGQEIEWQEVARRSGVPLAEIKETEKTSTTRRDRRVAEFSWSLLRRAATLNGPTDIALSFSDYLDKRNREARRFDQLTGETIRFIEEVECVAGAPVSLITTRFHYRGIIDRRAW